jgi:hypothetical protein
MDSRPKSEHKFAAISEPDMKLDAVVMPDVGGLTFEFNLGPTEFDRRMEGVDDRTAPAEINEQT